MTLPGRSSRAAAHQSASRRVLVASGVIGDDESLLAFGEGEVVAAEAAPDGGKRFALVLVVLAAVLGELDGSVALDDSGEEAAGADGR